MARTLTLHDADDLSVAISRATCCAFLLQLLDSYGALPPGSDFTEDVLEESKHALLDWQILEIRKIEEVMKRVNHDHEGTV